MTECKEGDGVGVVCLSTAVYLCFFFLMIRRPPGSTRVPYTTLFRSRRVGGRGGSGRRHPQHIASHLHHQRIGRTRMQRRVRCKVWIINGRASRGRPGSADSLGPSRIQRPPGKGVHRELRHLARSVTRLQRHRRREIGAVRCALRDHCAEYSRARSPEQRRRPTTPTLRRTVKVCCWLSASDTLLTFQPQ